MAAYYIKRLIDNLEENVNIGKAARETAMVRHDPHIIVDQLLDCYTKITKQYFYDTVKKGVKRISFVRRKELPKPN